MISEQRVHVIKLVSYSDSEDEVDESHSHLEDEDDESHSHSEDEDDKILQSPKRPVQPLV